MVASNSKCGPGPHFRLVPPAPEKSEKCGPGPVLRFYGPVLRFLVVLRRSFFPPRDCCEAREHRSGVAGQDLFTRVLANLRFGKRLCCPVDAELSAVGAAYDAIGTISAHAGLDCTRTE